MSHYASATRRVRRDVSVTRRRRRRRIAAAARRRARAGAELPQGASVFGVSDSFFCRNELARAGRRSIAHAVIAHAPVHVLLFSPHPPNSHHGDRARLSRACPKRATRRWARPPPRRRRWPRPSAHRRPRSSARRCDARGFARFSRLSCERRRAFSGAAGVQVCAAAHRRSRSSRHRRRPRRPPPRRRSARRAARSHRSRSTPRCAMESERERERAPSQLPSSSFTAREASVRAASRLDGRRFSFSALSFSNCVPP